MRKRGCGWEAKAFARLRRASHLSLRGQRKGGPKKGHPDGAPSGRPALVQCFAPAGPFRAAPEASGLGAARSQWQAPLASAATTAWRFRCAPIRAVLRRPSAALRSLTREQPLLRSRALHLARRRAAEMCRQARSPAPGQDARKARHRGGLSLGHPFFGPPFLWPRKERWLARRRRAKALALCSVTYRGDHALASYARQHAGTRSPVVVRATAKLSPPCGRRGTFCAQ